MLSIKLKHSKTDEERKGIKIGKTEDNLCPIIAMLNFLKVRGSHSDPYFACSPIFKT